MGMLRSIDCSRGFQFVDHPADELTTAHDFRETGFAGLIEFGRMNVRAECNSRASRYRGQLFGNELRGYNRRAEVDAQDGGCRRFGDEILDRGD